MTVDVDSIIHVSSTERTLEERRLSENTDVGRLYYDGTYRRLEACLQVPALDDTGSILLDHTFMRIIR